MKIGLAKALGLALIIGITGCGKQVKPSGSLTATSYENLGPASGNFRLIATDAPFSFDNVSSAKLTIDKIEAKSADSVVTSILKSPVVLDVVILKNGLVSSIVDLNLPPGDYSELRLFISSATVDLKEGNHYNLTVPSGASSGLKVFIAPAVKITTQASTDILLDFDLSRSFVPQGNLKSSNGITGFNFKPVIRAANMTTAGTITGQVMSDMGTPSASDDINLAGAVAKVSQNSEVVASAVADASGNFKMIGLPAGAYSLEIESEGFVTSSAVNVTVTAGNVSNAGSTLLALKPVTE